MKPSSAGFDVREEAWPGQAIERQPTARTAFVGRTLRGPVNEAVAVRSFAEFQQVFGGLWQPSPLGYAVEQFFDNGGRDALIVRVENGARPATLSLRAGSGFLRLRAVRPGTREFLRASVDYDNIPAGDAGRFNLTVQRIRTPGGERVEDQETHRRLTLDPADEHYLPRMLAGSALVRCGEPLPSMRPELTLDPLSGLASGYVYSSSDGDDGAPLTDYDVIGSPDAGTGLFALSAVDGFNFLCIPPLTRDHDVGMGTLLIAARYCRERRAMLIVDPPVKWQTADDALHGLHTWDFASEDALMFFPRLLAHDKLRGRFETFAPCGAVAGMLAKGDESAPVWGSGDSQFQVLRQGYRPVCQVPDDRRARLAALGVNTLQTVRSPLPPGLRLRTLGAAAATSPDWKYLAPRRLALLITNSIERGTRWVTVVQAHTQVASLVEAQVREFLAGLYAAGTFGACSVEDAYYVVGDRRAVGAAAGGKPGLQMLIGFAAERPGEFHSYRVAYSVLGVVVQPVTLNRLNCLHQIEPLREAQASARVAWRA